MITIAWEPPSGWMLRHEDGRTVLVHVDWDLPSLARNWGFVPCHCGKTDGTTDCPHKRVGEMIAAADGHLREHGDTPVTDPGYFDTD